MHDLDITDGQASFVSARHDAWHQLGVTLADTFTAEEAMVHGKLGGWNVRKRPMFTIDETGTPLEMETQAVVRTNPINGRTDVLSREGVGDGYQIVQNEEHAAFLNAVLHASGATFETAGALDGGRQVFLTMKLPSHLLVGGVDLVDNYLASVNSHDGNSAFMLMVTPVRVVCRNTLNLAFGGASNIFKVRHTTNIERSIRARAEEALKFSYNYLDGFAAEAEQLINTELTQAQFEAIINAEFGVADDASKAAKTRAEKRIEEMAELFADAGTQEGIRNTAWAGLNALTEWSDHFSGVRGDADTSRAIKAIKDPSFKNKALALMMAQV